MKEGSPAIVLAACIVAAMCCLLGGIILARSEHDERLDRSRTGHTAFVERLRRELLRLEDLYQSHLARFAENANLREERTLRNAASRIVGIRQVTVLSRHTTRPQSWNLDHEGQGNAEPPVVTFDTQASPLDGPEIIRLTGSRFLEAPETSGWLDEPGKPLYFWKRLHSRVVFILIDLPMVQTAIDGWLREWLPEPFAPVQLGEGADLVRGPAGRILIQGDAPHDVNDRRPHVLIPVESRFGTWHLASWDPIRRDVIYQTPILWGSGGVAAVLVLTGMLAYGHQRRLLLDARRRVSFVNHVSHELRSPLTNILLNAELAEEHAELDQRQALACLGLIREEGHRLNRLISNVLTFARTGRDRKRALSMPCQADEVIREVLAQFGGALERKRVHIEFAAGTGNDATVDRDPLFQIVANLVSNVEKYAAEGGLLRVETEVRSGFLHVRVMDHGPGISRREQEHVFEAFVRLDDRINEGVSGTGLGLHIARNLARENGGELRTVSSPKGAVFELSLPCAVLVRPGLS